jgi:hypothetical protein
MHPEVDGLVTIGLQEQPLVEVLEEHSATTFISQALFH